MRLFSLLPAIILLSLLAQQGFSQSTSVDIPSNPLRNIAHARIFFNRIIASSVLITSATQQGDYFLFTFEDSDTIVRAHKTVVASFVANQNTWKIYITYFDSTNHEVPYLGIDGISPITVDINPYDICPLVAELAFELKVPGKVRLTIVGRDSESLNLTHTFSQVAVSYVKLPVLGLYEDFANTVILSILSPSGSFRFEVAFPIQTIDLAPHSTLNVSKNEYPDNKNHFILLQANVYDQQGYLRWRKRAAPPTIENNYDVYPLTGGLFMTRMSGQGTDKVGEYTVLGELVKEYTISTGFHHEMVEKTPGGNLLIGSATVSGYEDAFVEVDRDTGSVLRSWDMADYVDPNRPVRSFIYQQYVTNNDWFHLNSVRYDPSDNTVVVSGRHQDTVCKIGYDDGETKWILSNHNDWAQEYEQYLLDPIGFDTTLDQDQDWTYLQHTGVPLANGNVIIFDNGGSRPGYTNDPAEDKLNILGQTCLPGVCGSYPGPASGYVRAVEYKVNPVAKTVEKVWEGTDFPTISTTIVGSVYPLSDDYLLIGYGEINTVSVMHKPTKNTVFMAHYQVPPLFYRAYPFEFYPEEATQSNGSVLRGSYLFGLVITIIFGLFI